jgi:hypothetical protein
MQRPLLPVFSVAALVVAGYAALVQWLPFEIEKGQNQGDTNLLRAQKYLAHPDQDTVLVGSSLTFRLPPPLLGPHIANVAMAGGAPATGLALLERSHARPKQVLIEINLLLREADLSQAQSLLRFPERQLRAHLRALQTGYDPVNLTERLLQALLHKGEEDLLPQPEAIRRLIEGQKETMSHPPEAGSLDRYLAQTGAIVSVLEARGIRIGFFEMPIDPGLSDLPAERDLRQAVRLRFPPSRYCWLTLSVPGGAHTVDGIHLTSQDAGQVAPQVVKQSSDCLKR